MQFEIEHLGPVRCRVQVEIPVNRVDSAFSKVYNQIAQQVSLPGFRRGKVPVAHLRKRYGAQARMDATQNLVDHSDVLPAGMAKVGGCVVAVGHFEGTLSRAPRGASGFGYDPIFELPDGRTVGELSAAEKHEISHRGEALRLIKPYLRTLFR